MSNAQAVKDLIASQQDFVILYYYLAGNVKLKRGAYNASPGESGRSLTELANLYLESESDEWLSIADFYDLKNQGLIESVGSASHNFKCQAYKAKR